MGKGAKGCLLMGSIGERRHRVSVCSQRDLILRDGEYVLAREAVIEGWSSIEPVKASRFTRDGVAITDNSMIPTHAICMNYNPDVNISLAGWIYEKRLKSPPRWFQILTVTNEGERSRFFKFMCRLVEANDQVKEPVTESDFKAVALPDGVML